MQLKNSGLKDVYFLGKSALNLTTSILITSALFASALVVSAWSAFILIISATTTTLLTAKPFIIRTLKALVLFVTIQ